MQPTEALRIVGYLAGLSNGWTDDSIAIYAKEIETLQSYEVALAAAQVVMRSWKETWKPPIATIIQAYNQEKQRKPVVPRFEVTQGSVVPPAQGIEIARAAYIEECARQGRQPNHQIFDTWARRIASNC